MRPKQISRGYQISIATCRNSKMIWISSSDPRPDWSVRPHQQAAIKSVYQSSLSSALMLAIPPLMPHQPEFVVLPDAKLHWLRQHQKYGHAQWSFFP
jgi:hypothetical protein